MPDEEEEFEFHFDYPLYVIRQQGGALILEYESDEYLPLFTERQRCAAYLKSARLSDCTAGKINSDESFYDLLHSVRASGVSLVMIDPDRPDAPTFQSATVDDFVESLGE